MSTLILADLGEYCFLWENLLTNDEKSGQYHSLLRVNIRMDRNIAEIIICWRDLMFQDNTVVNYADSCMFSSNFFFFSRLYVYFSDFLSSNCVNFAAKIS